MSGEMIRANQGHSIDVDLQLEEREPPEVLYHGTVERFLSSILEAGLVRGKRYHVYLKGFGDGTQSRSQAGQTGHPHSGCRGGDVS